MGTTETARVYVRLTNSLAFTDSPKVIRNDFNNSSHTNNWDLLFEELESNNGWSGSEKNAI
jgi:hypothetical protein